MSQRYFEGNKSFREDILSKYRGSIEKIGKENPYAKVIAFGEYSERTGLGVEKRPYMMENPFYRSPERALQIATEELGGKFKEFESSQTKLLQQQQSEIAKQLKILQDENTLGEQLLKDTRKLMRKEKRIGRRTEKERLQALQIARENAARASAAAAAPQVQYGGGLTPSAGGLMPRMGGTSQFKTRQSNMVNI